MFDVGFSEIVVIAVVALVVLGPEKLPKTARTLGHLFGRLQRYVNDVKSDIKREIDLDELRKLQQNVQTAAKEIETSMASVTGSVESSARSLESELNSAGGTGSASLPADPMPAPMHAEAEAQSPGATAPPDPASAATEAPRQASLPGFDRG